MKYINYEGSTILTGDLIADAVMDYAAVLGANARTDTVAVPAVAPDGAITHTTVLVGPSSEIVVSEAPDDELEPEDPVFIRHLRDAAMFVGVEQPVNADGGRRFVGADESDDHPAGD
ncbi:hypothetical protein [Curtobacterium sp. ISL-83]|uniref:hypothetical protein n=1 Tax=Curtobacterium sp. ISL-83 TaxID=2819145 RepID=UPI001BE8B4C1|nr:hypothetical protein [Curtobacterium sp. ISL-83]MBT2501430.1 hypothetical protein [Curtobacterium sp. ISL-83]